jgi:hypothetical protein
MTFPSLHALLLYALGCSHPTYGERAELFTYALTREGFQLHVQRIDPHAPDLRFSIALRETSFDTLPLALPRRPPKTRGRIPY